MVKQTVELSGANNIPYPDLSALPPDDRQWVEQERAKLDALTSSEDANLATIYGEAGMLYHAFNFHDTAIHCYRQAQSREPKNFSWTYYLAAAYRESNQLQPAIDAYRAALNLKGDYVPAMVTLGLLLMESELSAESGSLFDRAIALRPESAAAWYGKGRFALDTSDFQTAIDAFKKTLRLDPAATATHGLLARAYLAVEDQTSAEKHRGQQGERLPGIVDPMLVAVRDMAKPQRQLREMSRKAAADGNLDQAKQYLEKAVAMSPNDPLLQFNLGEVTRGLGNLDDAEKIFKGVMNYKLEDSLRVKTLIHLATIHSGRGELEPAFNYLNDAHKVDPKNPYVNFYMADVARLTGRFDQALAAYRMLVNQAPENYPLRLGRALCLIRLKRFPDAISALREDVRISNGLFTFYHLLARVLATVPASDGGNPAEALKIMRSLTREGLDSSTAATMAMSLAATGSWTEAISWQQKAIELSQTDSFTLREDLQIHLEGYKNRRLVKLPFPDHHPLFQQPNYANLN